MNVSRVLVVLVGLCLAGSGRASWWSDLLLRTKRPVVREMETTGYCNCETCCSWERSWFGFGHPVYTAGRLRGRRKEVGVTASGGQARLGTVAADTSVLPIGTLVFVPGFGWGHVEDRGGAIRGNRLDLWFEDHGQAKKWGRRKVPVKYWIPARDNSVTTP